MMVDAKLVLLDEVGAGVNRTLLNEINIPVAPAESASSFLKGKEIAQRFGFPLVIGPSFCQGQKANEFRVNTALHLKVQEMPSTILQRAVRRAVGISHRPSGQTQYRLRRRSRFYRRPPRARR